MDRRTLLTALVTVPAAMALLPACSGDSRTKPRGPDLSGADPGVRPQDDLYRHVNGKWLTEYPLEADATVYGTGAEVQDRNTSWLREYIEGIEHPVAGSDEQKVRDLYDACLDTAAVERLGLAPIQDLIDDIDSAATKSDLARLMGAVTIQIPRRGVLDPCSLFCVLVLPDPQDATTHTVVLGQAGIGLPASVYLRPQFTAQLDAYRILLQSLATAAGFPDPAGAAHRVLELEKRIVAEHWDEVRLRDTNAFLNRFKWSELSTLAPGFDWEAWRTGLGAPTERLGAVIVGEPSYFTAAAKIWMDTDIPLWREYLKLGVVREFAGLLSTGFADPDFAFTSVRTGLTKRPTRSEFAFAIVERYLGDVLSKAFVTQHFSSETKRQVEEIVTGIRKAHRDALTDSAWMTADTRASALTKLDRMGVGIGGPDSWQDYSGMTVTAGRLVASIRAAMRFGWKALFELAGTPVRPSEWRLHAHTTEAMYHPNAFELPAGILQPPFFDSGAEPAVNYGAIGTIIGHEIGHAFDDQGSHYDADGNLREWWTPADRTEFERRLHGLIPQFDGLIPEGLESPNRVDGTRTLSENSADLRGLIAALAAFRHAEQLRGITDPDFVPFFLAYARAWRRKSRPEVVANQLASDGHAPPEFRVNQIVRNVPEFYTAFGVREGDKLYLAPDQRITL
ncbi:M13 family metallopeptidase [Nocardia sp. NPDC058058]|uniref:M13 family metallopeptidase n=1 Tax=Nocardia sp. NPDC058058 TaxID=3346317 RepID=UPI0036D7F7CF